jgi:2,4-dienoyl-CoA reductase-like NADH-dependent reductase (Old Yellow Enzyme family)
MSLHEAGAYGFSNAELRDFIAMHAELPDLWDLANGTWEACSGTSRFKDEGAQEDLVRGIKDLTPKPVVGVGRFTSPDAMVRQIKTGILDFIGAARPSHRRPVPAAEGAGRPLRRHPRMHRLQHLRLGDMTAASAAAPRTPPSWRNGARAGTPTAPAPKARRKPS